MGETSNDETAVGKGEEHLGARIDADSYRRIRIAAAENDQSMAEFVRNAAAEALAELDEGNTNRAMTATTSS